MRNEKYDPKTLLSLTEPAAPVRSIELDRLIAENGLKVSSFAMAFGDLGYGRMCKSKDPSHTNRHLDRMFFRLNEFFKLNPRLARSVDINVLIISICWHDVWKAEQYNPSDTSDWKIISDNYREGLEAAELAGFEMHMFGFPQSAIERVFGAIYKHSDFQIVPRLAPEAKLLADLDWTEMWEPQRIPEYIEHLRNSPQINPDSLKSRALLGLFRFIYRQHRFHFSHFRDLAKQQIPVFEKMLAEALIEFRQEYRGVEPEL